MLAGILFVLLLASADFLSKYFLSLAVIFSKFLGHREVKRRPLRKVIAEIPDDQEISRK